MAQNLETMTREAAAQNLSFAAALERLADLELQARHGRAIERRFQLSRLPAQPTLDQFHFAHHKSRQQARNRILHLLDLDFLKQGTSVVIIGNPGVGKTFLAQILGWRACQANVRVLFTTAMEMLNQLLASQVDHSLVRKLKVYTEPTTLIVDELGYLALDQQTSNLFYQVISTAPWAQAQHHHHYQHRVLQLGQHPLQHHHWHPHARPAGGTSRRSFCWGPWSRRRSRRRFLKVGSSSGAALCDSPQPEESGG